MASAFSARPATRSAYASSALEPSTATLSTSPTRSTERGQMNYYDTLIEVADDCPATSGQVPQARGGKKTKAVVEDELLVKHPYTYTEEDIAFEVYAMLHDIPTASWPKERQKFLSKGHPHLRVSALAKRC